MKRLIAFLWVFCYLAILGNWVSAQGPILRNFGIEDGMPSSLVYMTMQDSKGYIWLGTDRGLARFDGNRFEVYSINDGLPSNDVWRISEDAKGRLWMSTFNKVCYFYNGRFETLNDPAFDENIESVQHFLFGDKHFILINYTYLYLIDLNNKITNTFKKFIDFDIISGGGIIIFETDNSKSLFEQKRSQLSLDDSQKLIYTSGAYLIDTNNHIKEQLDNFMCNADVLFSANIRKGQAAYIVNERIRIIDHNGMALEEQNRLENKFQYIDIKRIHQFGQNKFLIYGNGQQLVIDSMWQIVPGYEFIEQLPLQNIFIDRRENTWLSTRNGLLFLNKKSFTSKSFAIGARENVESLSSLSIDSSGQVWGVGSNGHLYRLAKDQSVLQQMTKVPIVQFPTDLKFDQQNILWIGAQKLAKVSHQYIADAQPFELKDDLANIYPQSIGAIKQILIPKKGFPLVATHASIYKINSIGPFTRKKFYSGRFYDLEMLSNGNLWISGKKGIELISAKGEKLPYTKQLNKSILQMPTNNIALDAEENLWFAANSRGVYRLSGNRVDSIGELQHLLVAGLMVDSQDRLWVSTNVGLAKISNFQSQPFSYQIEWFTEAEGLASNDVKEVLIDDHKIYVSTQKGLTILEDRPFQDEYEQAPFLLSNIRINGEDTILQSNYSLNDRQNNIQIEYQCLDYQKMNTLVFEYQLVGSEQEQDWQETREFEREFLFLPPGEYTFRVRRKGKVQSPELSVSFTIHPPWWQSGLFLFSVLLGLSALIYGILYWQIQRVQQKAEEENKLNQRFAELELRALQAQMNPHFIFNALHAIQDFIFKKDERVANHYLVKFSRLMRLFLESSKEKFIILKDEIQLLQLYIELEQLRFEDKFTFQIEVADDLAPSMIEIPSMLLQPFVENAINHGLVHLRDRGLLLLSFQQEGNRLHCRIEDNGIGRKKAQEIRAQSVKSYKSRGMQLVEERQRVWNIIGDASVDIEIEDLQEPDGTACGTRIDLYINIGT